MPQLGEIDIVNSIINKISYEQNEDGTSKERELPVRLKIYLLTVFNAIADDFKVFDTMKKSLLTKYGKEMEGKQGYVEIPKENMEDYTKEITVVAETEGKAEIEKFDQETLLSILDEKRVNLTFFELNILQRLMLSTGK